MRLPGFGTPQRGDAVVFNFPEGDTVVANYQNMSYYQLARMCGRENLLERDRVVFTMPDGRQGSAPTGGILIRPVDKQENYIKRCVGVSGDTVQVIDGLVHISDMSWTQRIKHPSEFCNVGDDIEVMVLEVDKENRRLSLGHKQEQENPWEVFAGVFVPGSTHEGTITGRAGQNFIVSLSYGVEGTVTAKNLKKADGGKAEMEEKLPFVVLEFNAEARRIVLSHTRTFEEGEEVIESAPAAGGKKGVRKEGSGGGATALKSVNEKVEKSTLGDLSVLSDLKSAMESKERTGKAKKAKKFVEDDDDDEA